MPKWSFLSGLKFTLIIKPGEYCHSVKIGLRTLLFLLMEASLCDIRWNWFFLTKFQKSPTTKDRNVAGPSNETSSKAFFLKNKKRYFFLKKQKTVIRQHIIGFFCLCQHFMTLTICFIWEICFLIFFYNFAC